MGVRQLTLRVRFVVERDENAFHAYCPDLEGLHVGGDTFDEALENAKEAAGLYICSLIKHDEPVPVGMIHGDRRYSFTEFLIEVMRERILGKKAIVGEVRLPQLNNELALA